MPTMIKSRWVIVIFGAGGSGHEIFWKLPRHISKTSLYNFDPLKPHFYIVKLGFTASTLFFSYFCSKHRLWILVRTASPHSKPINYILQCLTSTHNLYLEENYEKYQNFLSGNFKLLVVKFLVYLNRRVFVMTCDSGAEDGKQWTKSDTER